MAIDGNGVEVEVGRVPIEGGRGGSSRGVDDGASCSSVFFAVSVLRRDDTSEEGRGGMEMGRGFRSV